MAAKGPLTHATLGLRAHSGWAALVALGGPAQSPMVIHRLRIDLADRRRAESKQPYHAAAEMDFKDAEQFVHGAVAEARRLAQQRFCEVIETLREKRYEVTGCGVLLASGRPLPALPAILASHALIHTAEGEHFREALAHAAAECSLPVTKVRERELFERGSGEFGIPVEELQRRLGEMGRAIGPPWRQDEKLASLAAWLALAA